MTYRYKTEMTCSSEITFDLDGDVVTNIAFTGGCNGNLKAISKILDGWTVDQIVEKLEGNTCGRRPTSCADQLARAVKAAYEKSQIDN
ncbi:MAG: TIGR03905 family TSCPD domain-containing protein [Clostridia bacterium]|nr:TIGR03905 family TSCPD domain-containing protein [Clostridia bacterium]MBR6916475.1 TIGR03905 family TSCPD domain-containing protein [Clostridia bacterium]